MTGNKDMKSTVFYPCMWWCVLTALRHFWHIFFTPISTGYSLTSLTKSNLCTDEMHQSITEEIHTRRKLFKPKLVS